MSQSKNFRFGNHTDVGKVRHQNEDYMGFFENYNGAFFVVCDGMGGHVGGATASQTAVSSIRQFFEEQFHPQPQEAIHQAIQYANTQIHQKALSNPELRGMGTTCVLMMVRDNLIYYGHVGDSRIYLHRVRVLSQLTKDHSFVQALIEQGLITEAEAESHPRRNEILRALGTSPFVDVEVAEEPLHPLEGDILMLCTDGLNGMLSSKGLEEILNSNMSLQHKALKLVDTANQYGGTDNITVQLVEFLATLPAKRGFSNKLHESNPHSNADLGSTRPGSNLDPPPYVPPQSKEPEDVEPISEQSYAKNQQKRKKYDEEEEYDEKEYQSNKRGLSINTLDEVDYRPFLTRGFLIVFALVFGYVIFKNISTHKPTASEQSAIQRDSLDAVSLQNQFYEYTGIQKVKDTYKKTKETVIKAKETLEELNELQKRKRRALDSLFQNKKVRLIVNTLSSGEQTAQDLAKKYRSKVEWILKANGVKTEEELAELDSLSIPLEAPRP